VNASRYFELVKNMPLAPWQDLTRGRPFVVLSPHPDDESLGMGGLIALARHQQQDVSVIVMTDGEGSHPRSISYPRERLIATRRAELQAAGRILGLAPHGVHHLGLQDTAAPTSGPIFEQAVAKVSEIIERTRAATLFVTWDGDPHCDHRSASVLAEEIHRRMYQSVMLWSYPIWGWHLNAADQVTAPPPKGCRINITDVRATKRAAIDAHVSQMTDLIADDPDGFRFNDQTLAPFLSAFEYFIKVPV
jgi:LmbE family N-acetylglucosaminyl deacetylase